MKSSPMTPDQLRRLCLIDMPAEALREVMKIVHEDVETNRSKGAERMARYRQKRHCDVTRDVTCSVTGDVTSNAQSVTNTSPLPPPKGGVQGRGGEGEFVLEGTSTPRPKDVIESIYRLYPKKVGRGSAIKAITAALRLATAEQIIAGLERAKRTWIAKGTEEQYIPHPASWFNGQRWMDEELVTPVSVVSDEVHKTWREDQDRLDREEKERADATQERFLARARWRQADPATRGMIPYASPEEIFTYGGVIES